MKSRYVVRLFFSTLLIGGIAAVFTGFIVRRNEFHTYFSSFDIKQLLLTSAWLFGVGLLFSVISQMGFFAYLTIHRFGLGAFRSVKLWNSVQFVLIAFVLFDLVYLRYSAFGNGQSILPFISPAVIILIAGLIVAYIKAKSTNRGAFIPALFFMVTATIIEWVPVLRVNEESWLFLMLYPLIICNAYQLLILHKYNEKSVDTPVRGKGGSITGQAPGQN